jgi:hypothetical protein
VNQAASAQDPIQHAPNASANNGGAPVAAGLGSGVAGAAVSGGPVGQDAAIHLRRYTQITQRQQPREHWTANDKRDQLERLKQYYANPASLRGEQDPHRYLGQRAANTFTKDGHTMLYEGTIIAYNEGNGCYGVAYDDGDFESKTPTSSSPSSKNGLLKQAKRMPVRAYKLARHSHSCCLAPIHSSARLP